MGKLVGSVIGIVMALGSAADAKDPPDVAAIRALVAAEAKALEQAGDPLDPKVFAKDAGTAAPGDDVETNDVRGLRTMLDTYVISVQPSGLKVWTARDGKAAWVTFEADAEVACDSCNSRTERVRSSQLVVKTGDGWRVQASVWSAGVPDATVNKAARAGKQNTPAKVATSDEGDGSVRAALTALVTTGFDPALARDKQNLGIGSAPKESVAFSALVPFVNKSWVGKLALQGPVWATVAPSGTTAAAMANVALTKTEGKATYQVVFRWFVVFDKTAAGAWTPVHVHVAVP